MKKPVNGMQAGWSQLR